jgi:membrane dipeptidase
MIDLSHLNERGFWDVAALSDAPLVATHSNAHALCASSRNLTDRQLDAIRDSDGMVGVNFAVSFLREDGRDDTNTPLEAVVRHVDYLVERLGIDRVGFGSDFDGAMVPEAIGDVSGLPKLLAALREHGYGEAELRKLAHGNWISVLRRTWGG